MTTQIDALKQAAIVLYKREHGTGLNMDELLAYKAVVKAVKEATGEYWANGSWHVSMFD